MPSAFFDLIKECIHHRIKKSVTNLRKPLEVGLKLRPGQIYPKIPPIQTYDFFYIYNTLYGHKYGIQTAYKWDIGISGTENGIQQHTRIIQLVYHWYICRDPTANQMLGNDQKCIQIVYTVVKEQFLVYI